MIRIFPLAIIALLALFSGSTTAQDLIVTTDGDSLNCKITKQQDGFVHFRYLKEGQSKVTLLPVKKINSIIQAYYPIPVTEKRTSVHHSQDYSKWQYGVRAGYAYRTAKVSDQLNDEYQDYIKKLKSGFIVGGDIHHYISESLGFGLKYTLNKHKKDEGGDFNDNITMHYIAASFLNRFILANQDNYLLLGANLGYQSYKDKTVVLGYDVTVAGHRAGFGLDAKFGHKISPGAAILFGLSFTGATLTRIKAGSGSQKQTIKLPKDQNESLTRLELTPGLEFGK